MDIDIGSILQFLVEYKFWFLVLIPLAIAVIVIKIQQS